MMETNLFFALEILGTIAFAISGAMVGIRARMDILGVAVLGLTTACGGGIIRDLLIGVTPPNAFQHPVYALLAIAVSVVVFLPAIRSRIDTDASFLNVVDALGLGIFTVVGVRAGAPFGGFFLMQFLGVVTGVGGGVLRDIFAMEKPMIFVRHFYASSSFCGAVLYILLSPLSDNLAAVASVALVVVLRVLAAKYKWHLPKA